MKRLVVAGAILLAIVAVVAVTGCAGRATDPAAPVQLVQLIVKFRDPAFDPSRRGYLDELGREIRGTVIYVRAVSGGAHVLRCRSILGDQVVIERLRHRPEIEYVEDDRLLHPVHR